MSQASPHIDFRLHAKQLKALFTKATEVLFGGAAGGGKSHLIRAAAIIWCVAVPGLQIYLFRRIRDDLIKNHMEGSTGFRMLLAPWLDKWITIVDDEIRFTWNGSRIYLCHCKDEKDRLKYQGSEIHVLIIDELTHFTDVIYRFLRSRVRMNEAMKAQLPDAYKGKFPRIFCSANPGGIGHAFVKAMWIDTQAPMEIWRTSDDEGGFLRQFIPAVLSDNPSLDQREYERTLSGLGNKELVKAMRDGDWNVVAGAALDISPQRHMIRAFTPPKHWTRFTSFDWGFVKPYSQGWYCVVEGDTLIKGNGRFPDIVVPNGAIIRYRELYGVKRNEQGIAKPDEGMREESEIVVRKIMKIEKDAEEKIDYRIADTGIWSKNDGPSTFERMMNESRDEQGFVHFCPSQSIKDRQASYNELCMRLKGEEVSQDTFMPMFYVTENCRDWWRTVPPLILDDSQPEKGADEKQELHAYDETCYALMSRPMIKTAADRHHAAFHKARQIAKMGENDPYRSSYSAKKAKRSK